MEQSTGGPGEFEPTVEKEPQVADVVAAARHTLSELAPDLDPEDVEDALADLDGVVDVEDAMGTATSIFVQLGIPGDEGIERLGEILQVESIRPNGDQAQD